MALLTGSPYGVVHGFRSCRHHRITRRYIDLDIVASDRLELVIVAEGVSRVWNWSVAPIVKSKVNFH
ncbi:uncharacterized protein CANTADRAFT_24512, partial [Suhomyces tanzawaensis NRRL Y-17324]